MLNNNALPKLGARLCEFGNREYDSRKAPRVQTTLQIIKRLAGRRYMFARSSGLL